MDGDLELTVLCLYVFGSRVARFRAKQDAILDPHTGEQLAPAFPAGAKVLLDRLLELFFLDAADDAKLACEGIYDKMRNGRVFLVLDKEQQVPVTPLFS